MLSLITSVGSKNLELAISFSTYIYDLGIYFAGRLLPVNERATRTIRNLYVENERVNFCILVYINRNLAIIKICCYLCLWYYRVHSCYERCLLAK